MQDDYTTGFSEDGTTFTDSFGNVFHVQKETEGLTAPPKPTGRNVAALMRFPIAENTGKHEN